LNKKIGSSKEVLMFFLGPVGPTELVLIILIIVILFGAKKLPELGKSLGAGIKNFRSSIGGKDKEKNDNKPPTSPASGETSQKED
jgi:sec-independent protein translocase protein TatA